MGDCACAAYFYGIRLPEKICKEWYKCEDLFEKDLKQYNLKSYVDGCHVAGDNNIVFVGKFDTKARDWKYSEVKKAPSTVELEQVDNDIKAYCKFKGIKYPKPSWLLIAYYG